VLALKEVMREVDAGKRCAVCLMLRPCAHMGER
jgi:hypothetical protein